MNLNYDSFSLILEQVKIDLFILYTCRWCKRLIKDRKYTVGNSNSRSISRFKRYPFFSWGGIQNIDNYITGLLEDMEYPKYGIDIIKYDFMDLYIYSSKYKHIELHTKLWV